MPLIFLGILLLAGVAAWKGLLHGVAESGKGISGTVAIDPAFGATRAAQRRAVCHHSSPQAVPHGPWLPSGSSIRNSRCLFQITNADVMMPGSELRGMVVVVAPLDKDGSAGPAQPGDIEGEFAKNPTMVGADNIEIVLNKVK